MEINKINETLEKMIETTLGIFINFFKKSKQGGEEQLKKA